MSIVHLLDAEGGFTAGDTKTRITAYAYPTSPYATNAKRNAAKVAQQMLCAEHRSAENRTGTAYEAEYDARNWVRLEGKPTK